MSTIILEKVEIKEADFHLFEELFKKFKVRYQALTAKKTIEEDDTKMSKEAFFRRIDEARSQKGKYISDEEMDKMLLG